MAVLKFISLGFAIRFTITNCTLIKNGKKISWISLLVQALSIAAFLYLSA